MSAARSGHPVSASVRSSSSARISIARAAPADPPAAFLEALADDLNTPAAIAELSALATAANVAKKPAEQAKAKGELLAAAQLMGVLAHDPEHWFRESFGERAAAEMVRVSEKWGTSWFALPNPSYGSWLTAVDQEAPRQRPDVIEAFPYPPD